MTWRRQYPSLLFPGTSQWEPGASIRDVDMPAPLDSLNPLSWKETGRQLAAHSDVAILPFWHAALAPALTSVAREAKRQGKHLKLLDMKPSVQKEKERQEKEKAGEKAGSAKSSRPGFEGSKSKFLNSPTEKKKGSRKR